VLAHGFPGSVRVFDVVGILAGLQCRVPHPGAPVAPAADLALVLLVDEDLCALLLHFLVGDELAIIGKPRGAIVIGCRTQAVGRDRLEGVHQRRHDIGHVRNVGDIEFACEVETRVAGVIENPGKMGDVVFAGLAGAHQREILVAAREGPVDNLHAGLFRIGIKGVFAERFRDNSAPAVEADLGHVALRERLPGKRHLQAIGSAGGAKQAKEVSAADITVLEPLAQSFIASCIVHLVLHLWFRFSWRFTHRFLLQVSGQSPRRSAAARPSARS
jgi:hypothetical protein